MSFLLIMLLGFTNRSRVSNLLFVQIRYPASTAWHDWTVLMNAGVDVDKIPIFLKKVIYVMKWVVLLPQAPPFSASLIFICWLRQGFTPPFSSRLLLGVENFWGSAQTCRGSELPPPLGIILILPTKCTIFTQFERNGKACVCVCVCDHCVRLTDVELLNFHFGAHACVKRASQSAGMLAGLVTGCQRWRQYSLLCAGVTHCSLLWDGRCRCQEQYHLHCWKVMRPIKAQWDIHDSKLYHQYSFVD